MNPNINPKAKTNIKNMIRDALNCQKKNRNSIVFAFCTTTNNTKNPRKMLTVHLEFIVLFEVYCNATGGDKQGKACQKSGARIATGGPLGQPAAKAQGGDRFGIRDASATKKLSDRGLAQGFCPDNFIRVFGACLRGELFGLEDVDNLGGIARDRINLSQSREHASSMISLFDQFPSGARQRLFISFQGTGRELQKIPAEDRPVLVKKNDRVTGKKRNNDDGTRMFDNIHIRVPAVGQFLFNNREAELFALELH